MSNNILGEEKAKSILLSSHYITIFLYPVINSRTDLVSVSFKHNENSFY